MLPNVSTAVFATVFASRPETVVLFRSARIVVVLTCGLGQHRSTAMLNALFRLVIALSVLIWTADKLCGDVLKNSYTAKYIAEATKSPRYQDLV
jgi:hypothetical protein